ncbi:hypothetical protein NPIL_266741 [Nephila pilipes]|uniref:Uncharacterized protein n=1 Tax=Nephila pilipes TaxID=299642 RepID=A0A8X6Q3M7_NEPPI|nr:hypothetical protein NPIL_266741 [Nephila pilipes]
MEHNMVMENNNEMDNANNTNFHNQLDIDGIVQMMDNAFTADALTRMINVVDATLSALRKYPFEKETKQRNSIIDLEEITDKAKNRYITARKNELRFTAAVLDDTAQAWGKRIQDEEFTMVKNKKKSKTPISDNSVKKQRVEGATPCHNKFSQLSIEDILIASNNQMDATPSTSNATPPQILSTDNTHHNRRKFPLIPSQTKQGNRRHQTIKNPLEMLKDADLQDLYNVLEKFVNIAKNVPTPAESLQALFKLLN